MDVTFGGRYLGLWSVDAQQTNPLIIEGSAWEKGKLTFTSDSPECMPSSKGHPVDWVESRSSGKIELEFKPEAMAIFVQHVRYNKKHETLLTGFKEATVDDLKQEINRTLWECLGIVSCLIRNGKVLEEQNTVRYMTKCIILSLSYYKENIYSDTSLTAVYSYQCLLPVTTHLQGFHELVVQIFV